MALILDTGPIVALLDRGEIDHAACRLLLEEATELRVVPSPVLPEVDYLMSRRYGPGPFLSFLQDIEAGAFVVEDLAFEDYVRIAEVIDRYADARIGFVDAAVLAVVERLGEPKLATLDHRHFGLMRPRHIEALELVPA